MILAGGQGTRLWPLSRAARPKQFLPLIGDSSLFEQTLKRVSDPDRYAPPLVVTNAEYRFLVAEQALEMQVALSGTCSSRSRATPPPPSLPPRSSWPTASATRPCCMCSPPTTPLPPTNPIGRRSTAPPRPPAPGGW